MIARMGHARIFDIVFQAVYVSRKPTGSLLCVPSQTLNLASRWPSFLPLFLIKLKAVSTHATQSSLGARLKNYVCSVLVVGG